MFVVKFVVDAFDGDVYKNVWLKISKNFQRSFSQRECVLLVASKARLSTRAATCVAIAPLKGYERSEVEQTGDTLNKI